MVRHSWCANLLTSGTELRLKSGQVTKSDLGDGLKEIQVCILTFLEELRQS